VNSVLLVRLDAIGDALTLVPLVAALRRHDFRIGALLRPVNANVFSSGALDRVHIAAEPPQAQLVRELQEAGYDAALVVTEKPEGYRIARRAGIPVRIGFENGWGKPLKTLWVRRMCTQTHYRTAGLDPHAPHECEVVYSLACGLLPDPQPPRDARILRPLVIDQEPRPDSRIAFQVTEKWTRLGASPKDVIELAQRIGAHHAMRYIGAQAEAGYVRAFSNASGFSVETFATLAPWKTAIAAARAIVAPDSGAAHVAGIVGTAAVSCFAREHFALQSRRWAPWAAPHRVVCMEPSWPLVAADALEHLLNGSAAFSYRG
jgi:ADP-heptose:LPS heptosyltransferase